MPTGLLAEDLELEVAAVYQLWRALSEITVEDIDTKVRPALMRAAVSLL